MNNGVLAYLNTGLLPVDYYTPTYMRCLNVLDTSKLEGRI